MSDDRQKNSVLILSLGMGKAVKERKVESIDHQLSRWFASRNTLVSEGQGSTEEIDASAYRFATYSFRGDEKSKLNIFKKTSFVAEPLIKITNPNSIVVIGSIRSGWSSFYLKFATNPSETDYKNLYNIETGDHYTVIDNHLVNDENINKRGCGINTGGSELDEYERKINKIFQSAGCLSAGAEASIIIQVILIRYGIDEAQLTENYGRFKKITDVLKPGVKNEVSFDTSHSFRSIPLYNLVLLNYIETIEDFDISIKHVFNGCLDARFEYKVKIDDNWLSAAPIIDLHGIVDLMQLTDAVREFINTGNAVALTSTENSDSDDFLRCLKMFDWATQINDFGKIEEAIDKLAEFETAIYDHNSSTALNDRSKMILSVIQTRLMNNKKLSEFKALTPAEKRLMIAEWYQRQNRYGQAIATAIEAMRSMLVLYYLKYNNIDSNPRLIERPKYQRAAEDRFQKLKEYLLLNSTEPYRDESMEKAIINLAESLKHAKAVRNTFAHNRITKSNDTPDLIIAKEADSKAVIDEFLYNLRVLYEKIQSNELSFLELYRKGISSEKLNAGDKISDAVIIIDFTNNKSIRNSIWDTKLSMFKNYDKYLMPSDIFTKGGKNLMYAKAITDYLEAHFRIEQTAVILHVTSLKKIPNMIPMLRSRDFKDIIIIIDDSNIVTIPKGFYPEQYLEEISMVSPDFNCKKKLDTIDPEANKLNT